MANGIDKDELLSANDVTLVIRDPNGNEDWAGYHDDDEDDTTDPVLGKLVIDDYDMNVEKDDTVRSGVGTDEPLARVRGNKSYGFEFTLSGEDASLFNKIVDDTMLLEVEMVTNAHRHTMGGLDYEDFSISGSDGEVVEFDCSMSALSFDTEEL